MALTRDFKETIRARVARNAGRTLNLPSANEAVPVLISSAGQLGTVSSSRRFKEDIEDMGSASHDLMRLRPVTSSPTSVQVSASQATIRHYETYVAADQKHAGHLIACAYVVRPGNQVDNVFYVSFDRGQRGRTH